MSNYFQQQSDHQSQETPHPNTGDEGAGEPYASMGVAHRNRGLEDSHTQTSQAHATLLEPFIRAHPTPVFAHGDGYHVHSINSSWQHLSVQPTPSIDLSADLVHARGGIPSHFTSTRGGPPFSRDINPVVLHGNYAAFDTSVYQRDGLSLLEEISAEQEAYFMSLGQQEDRHPTYARQAIEDQIRSAAEVGSSSFDNPRLLSSDAGFVTGITSAPSPAVGSSSTRVLGSSTREAREAMFNNPAYHSACADIVDIMAQFKLPLGDDGEYPTVPGSVRERANARLDTFINNQSNEIKQWLESGRTENVASDDIMKAAVSRRSSGTRVYMHFCYWCGHWLTTKGNLANHIRSHLGFHISFCDKCSFSAVTATLPSRHKGRCRGRRGGSS